MIDKSKIVFVSNYYRHSFFFKDTIRRILNSGYDVVIQSTGGSNEFGTLNLTHPQLSVVNAGNKSYDAGVVSLKENINFSKYDYIILLDNDLFMSSIVEMEEYIGEFIGGGYDFACHLVGEKYSNMYDYGNKHIAEVKDQAFLPPELIDQPDILTPSPHWENAYLIVRREMWDKMSSLDVSHHRRFIHAVHRENAKLGSHKANYRWGFTNWGREWFHVGHLMSYYLYLEGKNIEKFDRDSEFDLFRAGYFFAQEEKYGPGIYSSKINESLMMLEKHIGGKSKALDVWNKYIKDTCMENWEADD